MKIHTGFEQNSVDWMLMRSGKVTASEADALVTPLGKVKTGDGPKSYLMQKLCEAWIGGPLPSVQGIFDMEQGRILEEEAKPAFSLETGLEIRNVAFISSDDDCFGCSPDGLIGDSEGIEIKCPRMDNHVRYILDGIVPTDYIVQVQMSLFVTKFKSWKFMSYRRNFPLLIVTVLPDPKLQDAIAAALEGFQMQFKDAWSRLVELNGGPPKRSIPKPTNPQPTDDGHGICP